LFLIKLISKFYLNYITGDTVTDVTADVGGCSSAECTLGEFTNRSIPYKIEDVKQVRIDKIMISFEA
jgi:hypothetical protein